MSTKIITLNVEGADKTELERYQEILLALIHSGGMTGVKGGQTILHFDQDGNFVGVQLSYWPWKKKKTQNGIMLKEGV